MTYFFSIIHLTSHRAKNLNLTTIQSGLFLCRFLDEGIITVNSYPTSKTNNFKGSGLPKSTGCQCYLRGLSQLLLCIKGTVGFKKKMVGQKESGLTIRDRKIPNTLKKAPGGNQEPPLEPAKPLLQDRTAKVRKKAQIPKVFRSA